MERIAYLGQEIMPTVSFLDKQGRPLQSKDPLLYPVFRVIDPMQDEIYTSIGTYNSNTHCYEGYYTLPDNAMLSTDTNHYMVEWEFMDTADRVYFHREMFDVVHPSWDLTEAREQQKLTLAMTDLHLSLPLPKRVLNVELQIFTQGNATPVFTGTPEQQGMYSEYFIYSIDIPAGTFKEGTDSMAIWIINDGTTSVFTQMIRCASLWEMQRVSDLRMYVDKIQKAVDLYVGIRDSELIFHLQRGAEYINSIKIPTNWTLQTWQGMYQLQGVVYWLLEAAKWSFLRSQYMAYAESAFSFSGAPVTLDYDLTGAIESELGRVQSGLENQLPQIKTQIVKNIKAVGHLNLTWPTSIGRYQWWTGLALAGIPLHTWPTFRI